MIDSNGFENRAAYRRNKHYEVVFSQVDYIDISSERFELR